MESPEQQPNLTGRSYTPEERERISSSLQNFKEEASTPLEGETSKAEDDVKLLDTINEMLTIELGMLGVGEYSPLPNERVHLLNKETYQRLFPESKSKAFYRSVPDALYVNMDEPETREQLFATILHEMVHRASLKRFYHDRDDGGISDARVGYRLNSSWKETSRSDRNRGLNELMTDYTVYKMLVGNGSRLEEMGYAKDMAHGSLYTYMKYGPIFDQILSKVSEQTNTSKLDVFEKLERGLFSGTMLHLKILDQVFGAGSLEVLSLLDTLPSSGPEHDKLDDMIVTYFEAGDSAEREQQRAKILKFHEEFYKRNPDAEQRGVQIYA